MGIEKDFLERKVAYTFNSREDIIDFLKKWDDYIGNTPGLWPSAAVANIENGIICGKSIKTNGAILMWNTTIIPSKPYQSNNYIVELI